MVDSANGRILAVLESEIANIKDRLDDMRQLALQDRKDSKQQQAGIQSELKQLSSHFVKLASDQLDRVTDLEKRDATKSERWIAHREEHVRENRVLAAISTVGNFIGAIVGVFVNLPPP